MNVTAEPSSQVADDLRPEWLGRHRVSVVGLSLGDVIGLRAAKREIQSLVARLVHPEVIIDAGGDLPRGVLLYGPAGCGKTLLARVMASMLAAGGQQVEFYSVAASDLDAPRFELLSRWLGGRAADSPLVVIYVDEIDLWGRERDDYRHSDRTRATLLGALAAIDGLDAPASRNRVLWLASSNRAPRELDGALVRAGRFGFSVKVVWPTQEERAEILAHYAATRRVAPDIDWQRAAALAGARTSPAELRQALDDALALALADRKSAADGLGPAADSAPSPIVQFTHVSEAIRRHGDIRDEPLPSRERLWEAALHEAGHAVANLAAGFRLVALTLRRDGGVTEAMSGSSEVEEGLLGAPTLAAKATVSMAGLAAERLILGRYGLGGSGDVAGATRVALALIDEGTVAGARPVLYGSFEESPAAMDERFLAAAAIVAAARSEAEGIISASRPAVEMLATELLRAEHLSGAELEAALSKAGLRQPGEARSGTDSADSGGLVEARR